jgi:hypothetical protein
LDLTIDTQREKLLRIKQVIRDADMLGEYDMDDTAKADVVEFINANAERMRELSLRMVLKVADIRVSMPERWQAVVEVTCMRNA